MNDSTPLAVAYYMNGINFRASAEKLSDGLELDELGRPKRITAIPLYFLASHAAELFLKAALLKRGTPADDLRKVKYRHSLSSLLELLKGKGVAVSKDTSALVVGLAEQHAAHSLRYTVLVADGKKTYWPPLSLVFFALDELLLLTRVGAQETLPVLQ